MKKILAILSFLLSAHAGAATINLSCDGVSSGQKIAEERSVFDISVNDKTGAMSLPASPTGCYSLPELKKQLKASCSIDDVNAKCTCETFWGTAFITLSRSTATLTIDKTWNDNTQSKGIYQCKKVTGKIF